MLTLTESIVSSSGRRLALRRRPDLVARRHRYQGRYYWIVKDPLGLHYFRFQEEEFFLLEHLDGQSSLDQIKAAFEEEFPPQKIRVEELSQFIGMLHRSGLVLSDAAGQGEQLRQRRAERRRQEWLGQASNLLALRFRGINPDSLLNWLEPRLRWIYTPVAMACLVLLAISAGLLVTVEFDEFQAKLPEFRQFFTVGNAFWLMVVLAVTKVIHEFGHGVSCKHFGGECHELGVMLLVLTPCLYCNVSDSWMLPNKWHRAAIGAGGMIVEIAMASVATFIWWFSGPGLLNHLCFNVMFVCSVSTLVFNGNPLLRYDGYYILADLMEVPNLGQKASTLFSRKAGEWLLGLEMQDDPFLPRYHQGLFVAYAVASTIYRWVVVFSILFFLNEFFKPYRLEIIGRALGMMSIGGLVVYPMWKLGKYFAVPGRLDLVDHRRLSWSAGGAALLLLALFFLPLPHRVYATLELEAHDAAAVYSEVPGLLRVVYVRPGEQVAAGTKLAELDNVDVRLAVEELRGRRNQYRTQLLSLRHQRFEDESAGLQLPQVQESLAAVEEQLAQKLKDQARLTLMAPVAGTVLPGPDMPEQPSADGDLESWWGSPFETGNLGCLMTEQNMFCQIGDPRRMHALVVVEQSDVPFLAVGQTVDIKLGALPSHTWRSEVREISSADVKISPRHLSNKTGGELATKTDPSGVERPLTTSYHVLVYPLDDADGELLIGMRGEAKIYAHWQPVGRRLWRWFSQTFHFKL
ncbi:MAG TPA: hemolysin D [Pirellulales bacterium]|jgi:putative peptide zinc metalloprotease protein|nr:hemolysin D [Pirellulales bacterium]